MSLGCLRQVATGMALMRGGVCLCVDDYMMNLLLHNLISVITAGKHLLPRMLHGHVAMYIIGNGKVQQRQLFLIDAAS